MLKNLSVHNFKSIHNSTVDLGSLTTLIGANGSGKSNLVKALKFLSSLSSDGVAATINNHGGFDGIIPKSIPRSDLRDRSIWFDYTVELNRPPNYPEELPKPTVEHQIEISQSQKEIAKINSEIIRFNQVIPWARSMSYSSESEVLNSSLPEYSYFQFKRGPRSGMSYEAAPKVTQLTIPDYLEWLHVRPSPRIKFKNDFNQLLSNLVESFSRASKPGAANINSFLGPELSLMLSLIPQGNLFLQSIFSIKIYDLFLSELRTEQQGTTSRQLSSEGKNMPSVLRYISSVDQYRERWDRIRSTFGAIAPHVVNMDSRPLRAGKEFVQFVESRGGRAVESWESSDGTLRALAILLALETHPDNSTILIEEPELNLHPWAIGYLVEHMREVLKERYIQIILTTHSQHILELMHPDEVIVSEREKKLGTSFHTLESLSPTSSIDMGEIGQLWVNGLLGGVPS